MQVMYWENESVLMIGPKGDSLFYSEHKVCLRGVHLYVLVFIDTCAHACGYMML